MPFIFTPQLKAVKSYRASLVLQKWDHTAMLDLYIHIF